MRIEAPVRTSTLLTLTEPLNIKGYNIKKGQVILIPFVHLHHNPKEWQEPQSFIPERFDPQSSYYLTPEGKKRIPASYCPFLGGKRICMGKSFAENIAKVIISIIMSQLEFDFVNPDNYERKP